MLARNSTSAAARGLRELRLEVLEDVEVGLQRVADVDVALVAAGPEERLAAGDVLDVVGDRPRARAARAYSASPKSSPTGPDHARLGEERRGEREVHGGAAEQAVALAGRRLDGVERDGSDDGERSWRAQRSGSRRARRCARSGSASGAAPRCSSSSRTRRCPSPATARSSIRVARAGINFADTHARENSYLARYELPLIPGAEVAGRRATRHRRQRVVALVRHRRLRRVRRRARGDDVPDPGRRRATPPRWRCCSRAYRLAPVPDVGAAAPRARASSCTPRPAASARWPCSSARPSAPGRVIATASTRGEARRSRSSSAPTPRSTSRAEDLAERADRGQRRRSRVDVVLEMAGGRVFDASLDGARAVRAPRHLRDRLARAERGRAPAR